jgi:hypothetical protein
MEKFSYDVQKYDFCSLVKGALNCDVLDEAHNLLPENITYDEVFDIDSDNKTWFHKQFYKKLNKGWGEFMSLYDSFIKDVMSGHFNERLVYQAKPTFRIHLPENVAVGAYDNHKFGFHKDSSPGYDHPRDEINIFLPLTRAYGTNTIWVESEEDKGDFSPMEADYGDYYIWKGSHLSHGNKLNTTKKSRVSIDFRIMPISCYKPENYKSSRNTNKRFIIGDYYNEVI